MGFLNKILQRPDSERAEMIVVVGLPAADCQVPVIDKKPLAVLATFV
jgi:hypothetical protein